jgi:hypothetical protein
MAITAADWGRRVEITTTTTVATLSGFVGLITEANLPSEIWTLAINGGGDLRVCENSDGSNQLPLQVVSFVTGTSKAALWTRFGSFATGQSLWLFYDKAGEIQPAVGASFGRDAVWVDYLAVLNLQEPVNTTADGYVDSTGNGYDGTGVSMSLPTVSANFGTAQDFDGSGDLIQIPEALTDAMGTNNTFVMSAWVNLDNTSGNQAVIGASRSFRKNYFIEAKTSNYIAMIGTGNNSDETANSGGAIASQWQLLHSTWDGSTLSLYVDGALLDSITSTEISRTSDSRETAIGSVSGQSGNEGDFLDGQVHSVRFSNVVTGWSANKIATEESNQSAPASFWTTGTPENTVSGGIVIAPASIASAESFGTPTITTGVVLIDPVAIPTQENVGTPTISSGVTIISPPAIASQESVGEPIVTPQGVVIQPVVIATEESVGAPTLVTGVVIVIPDGISTEEAVGDPVIQLILQQIFPDEILTEEFVGQPAVLGGAVIAIPVLSRQTWNAVAKYLRGLVFKGADNDVIVAWLRSEGLEEGAYNDLWHNYLLQNGFLDGSLTDKYAAWRQNLAGDDPWLLSDGNWNDTKIWIDNETWRDN